MSEAQYWDEDCRLVEFYRKAEKLRIERRNREMWLQGMYFYDALGRVAPIMHAFAKKGTKPKPYIEEPYPLDKKEVEDAQVKKDKARAKKGKQYMEAFMVKNNQRYERK